MILYQITKTSYINLNQVVLVYETSESYGSDKKITILETTKNEIVVHKPLNIVLNEIQELKCENF